MKLNPVTQKAIQRVRDFLMDNGYISKSLYPTRSTQIINADQHAAKIVKAASEIKDNEPKKVEIGVVGTAVLTRSHSKIFVATLAGTDQVTFTL